MIEDLSEPDVVRQTQEKLTPIVFQSETLFSTIKRKSKTGIKL
jgi:hypothetical protein